MNRIVADTDVVSFLFKNHPISQRYDPEFVGRVALISFMTVAELERWAIQHHWSEHRVRNALTPGSPRRRFCTTRLWSLTTGPTTLVFPA